MHLYAEAARRDNVVTEAFQFAMQATMRGKSVHVRPDLSRYRFSLEAGLEAAEHADNVRVNPGQGAHTKRSIVARVFGREAAGGTGADRAAVTQVKRAGGNRAYLATATSAPIGSSTPSEAAREDLSGTASPAAAPLPERTSQVSGVIQSQAATTDQGNGHWVPLRSTRSERGEIIVSLAVTALAASVIAAVAPQGPTLDLVTLLILIGFVAISEGLCLTLLDDRDASITDIPILAAGMLLGVAGAAIVGPISMIIRGIRGRYGWYEFPSTVSTCVIASSGAAGFFHLFAPPLEASNLPALLLPGAVAGLVFNLHTVSSATTVGTEPRIGPAKVWAENFRRQAPQSLILSLMGLLLALAHREFGLVGAAAFVVPPLMMRHVAQQRIDRTLEHVRQLRALNSQLADSEACLRTLHEAVACGILVRDESGAIVHANEPALEILGASFEQLSDWTSNSDWQLTRENGARLTREEHPIEVAFHTGRPVRRFPMSVIRPDGEQCWLLVDSMPLLNGDGRPIQVVTTFIDITARKRAEEALERQALHDTLTSLPNRTVLHDRLEQALLGAQRDNSIVAVLVMDLDRFKEVNDTLGHHCGDLLLQGVSRRLRTALRVSDTVARLGGDEFAVILPGIGDAAAVTVIVEKLQSAMEQPLSLEGHSLGVRASIGIALYPEHGGDVASLLRHADSAMYMAKRARTGYTFYTTEHDENGISRLPLMDELRKGTEEKELDLGFQPTVSLRTGLVDGVGSLARWRHPKHSLTIRDRWIQLAEQTGLIQPLSTWVPRATLRRYLAWRASAMVLRIAVSVSMRKLHDPELSDLLAQLLSWRGLAAEYLELESTESALISDPGRAMQVLERLQDAGTSASIDDFGTGSSSLTYLKRLPVREKKFDKSFVEETSASTRGEAIVRSIIRSGHDLGLRVVTEGVEDRATVDSLTYEQCDFAQGCYLSRPVPAADLLLYLSERRKTEVPPRKTLHTRTPTAVLG